MRTMESIVSLLKGIGLNQYEAKAYAALLLMGDATAGELSNRAELPRPRVYDIINRLEKKGFVVVQPGRPVKYRAVPPKEAMENFLKMRREMFEKEVAKIREVAEKIEEMASSPTMKKEESGFWLINSDNMLRNRLHQLLSSSEKEVVVTLTPDFLVEYGNVILPAVEDLTSRGVRVRLIVPKGIRGTFAVSGDVDVIETEENLPPAVVVDDKRMIMGVPGDKRGILMEHPELSRSFKKMIESFVNYV